MHMADSSLSMLLAIWLDAGNLVKHVFNTYSSNGHNKSSVYKNHYKHIKVKSYIMLRPRLGRISLFGYEASHILWMASRSLQGRPSNADCFFQLTFVHYPLNSFLF